MVYLIRKKELHRKAVKDQRALGEVQSNVERLFEEMRKECKETYKNGQLKSLKRRKYSESNGRRQQKNA